MTVQEVLTSYELYPHSKEHYDLLKEEAELTLMEMYIAEVVILGE